jgi:hypothetical protein
MTAMPNHAYNRPRVSRWLLQTRRPTGSSGTLRRQLLLFSLGHES